MTQGGFYKHFGSKDALAAEACELAFTKAAENWRRVAQDAADHGRDVANAITAYYLAPKSPEMTCPMVALATDVAKRARMIRYAAHIMRACVACSIHSPSSPRPTHLVLQRIG